MKHLFALASCTLICSATFGQGVIDRYLTDALTYTDIVTSGDQVDNPRDLDFKPHTNELWVMLRGSSNGGSFVIVHNAGLAGQTDEYRKDTHSGHFMIQASAMAFSPNGEFATVQEVQNTASPTSTFMGPALWNADLNIFAEVFQNNWVTGLPLGSHIDMLHQSPYAMGIAADSAKVYWVMDGHNGNICRYDFVQDHGPGYDYHGAGKIWRYIDVPVERVANIPSHMVLDKANGWLYFIDGGNKQIKRLNVWSGSVTGNLSVPNTSPEPLAGYKKVEGATVEIVDTWTTQPCGIEYAQGRLLVSDHTNGDIKVYDVSGTPTAMGTIATGQAGIMGLKIGPDGKIWFVNNTQEKVVRIDPSPLADDAGITAIVTPVVVTYNNDFYSIEDAVCGPSIAPVITVKNNGNNTLTSLTMHYGLDEDALTEYIWSGSVNAGDEMTMNLPELASPSGSHTLIVQVVSANGNTDTNPFNDRVEGSYRSIDPVQPLPIVETFTATEFPPAGWQYVHFNPNNYMDHNASYGGFGMSTGCAKMDNYSGEMDITGQRDYLLMPRIDLSTAPPSTALGFAVAHRQYNTSSTDRLLVKASSDCGANWTTLYDKQGAVLSTGTPLTATFNPSASQWRTDYVELDPMVGQPDVLIMFETVSDFGNNIYIDDVQIGATVGVEENENSAFALYPNPSEGQFSIRATGRVKGLAQVRVYALDGTLVQTNSWSIANGGILNVDLGGTARGSYVVEITDARNERNRIPVVIH